MGTVALVSVAPTARETTIESSRVSVLPTGNGNVEGMVDELLPTLILNPASGPETNEPHLLVEAARSAGVRVVALEEGDDLEAIASEVAPTASLLGMAGGDGSLGVVAKECISHDIPFVCVPFGTRNHFALDLGLDRSDPVAALEGFTAGNERRVDVGWLGDRVFLNNLTFGVYAEAVHTDEYREGRLRTGLRVTRELLRGSVDADAFTIDDPDGNSYESPFALLIANNLYGDGARLADLGRRSSLDQGLLQVSVIDADTGWDLAGLIVAAATQGTPEDHGAFQRWTAPAVTILSTQPVLRAGLDGEAVSLDVPVEVLVGPRVLRVAIPASNEG